MSFKRNLKLLLTLTGLLGMGLIAGCGVSQAEGKKVTMQKNAQTNNDQTIAKLEPISSVSFDGEQISLSVVSTGCTSADNFAVVHEEVDGVCRVKITRNLPDMCRRAPFIADIKLDWSKPESCGDMPVVFDNPMLVTPADGFLQKRVK